MELAAETEIGTSVQAFPTSTPVLDVLRPWASQNVERIITANYFLISSAVILGFTELPVIRSFVESISRQSLPVFWLALVVLPLIALGASLAVHEAGHTLAARWAGFEVVAVKLGGFTIYRHSHSAEEVLSAGFLVLKPGEGANLRGRLAALVAGGPVASLLLPVLVEGVFRLLYSQGMAEHFLLAAGIHIFSALSFLLGIAALLPDLDSGGNFSDGARLLMLAKNDARCRRWLAVVELQLALDGGKHPREWDESLVACALAEPDQSFDMAAANWLAYLWAAGRQDVRMATRHLEETLAALGASPGHLRDRVFLEASVFQAWYRHNLAKARFWASQINRLKLLPPLERLRLEIGLRWAEGQSFIAWENLAEYSRLVLLLPSSPRRQLLEDATQEWKEQMESRMLAGAWATMHANAVSSSVAALQIAGETVST